MPTQKLVHQFKNPNNNNWINFWTFNENGNDKIELSSRVILDSNNLTNINGLIQKITNADLSQSFWKVVSTENNGYAPRGQSNCFLYMDENGNAQWVNPKYDKIFYTVTTNVQKPTEEIIGQVREDGKRNILQPRGQSTTDFILDLNDFLWNSVSVTLNSTTNATSLTTS